MDSNSLLKEERIWQVVQLIPEGAVASYGQIADLAGLPGRARLVGKCLGKVPEHGYKDRFVPWYRVLRSTGQIAFPVGSKHFDEQRAKLTAEGIEVKSNRVSIKRFGWQPDILSIMNLLP